MTGLRLHSTALEAQSRKHLDNNNLWLALAMMSSAVALEKQEHKADVDKFLDRLDDERLGYEDDSREFDRDRYSYDRVDDFHNFKNAWTVYLDDNFEW